MAFTSKSVYIYIYIYRFTSKYSTSFCFICTSQVSKQEINKAFYIFDKLKVLSRLDDNSPTCTYPAKDTTENTMLQKSTLPNVKCKFTFNILT